MLAMITYYADVFRRIKLKVHSEYVLNRTSLLHLSTRSYISPEINSRVSQSRWEPSKIIDESPT